MLNKENKDDCLGLARFFNVGTRRGVDVCEVSSAAAVYEYSWEWKGNGMDASPNVWLNDKEAQDLILKGKKPDADTKYDKKISMEPPEGSSLYMVHWRFPSPSIESKAKTIDYFAKMKEEQVPDEITVLGRYHGISNGEGLAVVCVPNDQNSYMLLHEWTSTWGDYEDLWLETVLTDAQVQKKLVKSNPGFERILTPKVKTPQQPQFFSGKIVLGNISINKRRVVAPGAA